MEGTKKLDLGTTHVSTSMAGIVLTHG